MLRRKGAKFIIFPDALNLMQFFLKVTNVDVLLIEVNFRQWNIIDNFALYK